MKNEAVIPVDARGLRCPLPVLRLRKAAQGRCGTVALLTDDPAAETDVPAFAAEMGWTISLCTREAGATRWTIVIR